MLHARDFSIRFLLAIYRQIVANKVVAGAHNGLPNSHMKLAEELLTTCYQTYAKQPTFLAPEITYFNFQVTPAFSSLVINL